MAEIEVLAELAGLEPDKGGRHAGEDEGGDEAALLGGQRSAIGSDDDEVKQVVFTLGLIPVWPDGSREVVVVDGPEREVLTLGSTGRFEGGKPDLLVSADVVDKAGEDLVAANLLFGVWS